MLLPPIPGLTFEQWLSDGVALTVVMTMTTPTAVCPVCQQTTNRVHSHYPRTVADLAWAGHTVRLALTVRRFFCDNAACVRHIFCERLGQMIQAYARRTQRLAEQLQALDPPQPEPALSAAEMRFAEVKTLQQAGWSQRQVARQLGLHRRTVSRYWALDTYPPPVREAQHTSQVLPHLDYLRDRWQAGCHNIRQLFEDLVRERQFAGSYHSVWRAVTRYLDKEAAEPATPTVPPVRALSARQAAWLLVSPPEDLKPEQTRLRHSLCELSPTAAQAYELAQAFGTMIRQRQVEALDGWLAAARASGIAAFQGLATSLQRDYEAVKAALVLPWSNGQVEGQVNRLKVIKRQMYGRANFDLLRQRVLYA